MPDLFENTLHSTLIPTKVASEISGYNADYLARLCREEKIQGTQVGRSWLINRVSLEAFVKTQEGKKVERAESLRAEREKEYRRAQKPIMRAAFGSAVVEKTATTRSVISSSPSHQHSTYSRPLVAAAIALMFVTGVAYASSNAAVIGTLASVPNAVVAFARSSSANLISHASFRVTDSKNDKNNALATSATTSPFAFAMRAPSINNTSDALAVFSARASAKSISSVHALTDEARLPFEQTKTAQVAQGRIATLASIAHDPFGSAVNAYVMSGLSLYDAGAVLGDSYLRAINSSGDAALASAATTRDVFAFIPQASTALLDTYAQGVDAFNDVAPKVAGTAILAVYDLGDTTNTAVSAVPSLASQTKDTVANGIVRSALATAASIQNTEANAFAPFVHGAKTLAAIPRAAENTMLGIAGYTAALIDGPQAQPQTLGVAPSTQTAQAASFVSFLPDAWLHGIADAFHSIGNLAQGLISSGFHSLATVLPGGTFITPVLTVLPVGPSETLALPVPAGSLTHVLGTSENTTTTTTGGNTAGGGTTIKQIINNFYPQTLFGSAMQDAVLAIVRPYVQDSIDAAIVSTHSNGGGNTTVVNNSGVSSDGATLTNVNIQSGNGTFSSVTTGTLTAGPSTLATTTVNGDLTVTGNLYANVVISTSSFSGSGSNFNADYLDGFDSTYFLANSFSSTSAAYYLSQNPPAGGSGFSTTSANYWLTGKTTDNLTEGTTNKYYSDTLARNAFSTNATGLTYTSGTGVLSLTSGYSIPLTASTTEWNSAYANRITTANAPLSITGNAISISQANATTNGYLSSTDWNTFNGKISSTSLSSTAPGLAYNSNTGVFSLTAGYTIPTIASTSAWETFYQTPSSRIAAGTNLSWVGNTLNGPSDAYIRGLFSAVSPLSYNSATGVFAFSTSSISGSGSNFNADLLDGLDSAYLLANSFSTSSADFWKTQNNFFSTTSADYWLTGKSTDNLAQGITNLYYSDSRVNSFIAASTTIPKTYTSNVFSNSNIFNGGLTVGTLNGPLQANNGVVSATSSVGVLYGGTGLPVLPSNGQILVGNGTGYTLTSTSTLGLESTLTFTTPLSRTGNVISILQSSGVQSGYLSSTDWNAFNNKISSTSLSAGTGISYNSSTGVIANTGVISFNGRSGVVVPGSSDYTTAQVAESGNLYYTDARARAAISSSATGLTYTSGSGVLSLTAGYTIPLTASTTEWNTAYANRITTANAPLSIAGNAISISQANTSTNGYLSSTDWNTFNGKQTAISFAYPLVNTSNTVSLAFGTSTSNTWGGTQTFTNAPVLGSLTGFLKATAGVLSTSLIDLSTDVSSTLAVSNGGTGLTSYTPGDILYADAGGFLTKLPIGSGGSVLKVQAGLPSWGVDQTVGGGGSDGIFATSTGKIYPLDTASTVIIGANATATANSIFEVSGEAYVSTRLSVGSTSPSSLAILDIGGNAYISGTGTFGQIVDGGLTANTLTYANGSKQLSSVTLGNGLTLVGGTLSVSTSSISGSGSNFNADFLDGQDGTYYLNRANHTGTQLASTISDFSSTARGLLSSTATGLTYTSGTGVFSLTSGYTIPLTASTTEWNSAYANRITSATAPLSISSNTISITQANGSTDGYLSSTDWNTFNSKISSTSLSAGTGISYNSSTGVIANTGVISFNGRSGAVVPGSSDYTTAQVAESGNLYFTNARADARINATSTIGTLTSAPNLGTVLTSLTGILRATSGVLSTGAINLASGDVTGTLPVANGGTGSTTLTGILGGNGTGAVKTIVVGSGLTFDGTTLATSGAGITAIGPAGQLQTGGTQTLATTTSTFNGLTAGITITAAGNTQTFQPTLSGVLTYAGGGTGISSPVAAGVLLGNYSGTGYMQIATSSLGLTTTNVAEGSNLYYTDARARAAISSTATGLTYTSGTGVFSLTAGYTIPLTASTTEWNTAYANRITTANAPLSISNNAISISQANTSTNGYLSSTDWNTFNNKISSTSLSAVYPLAYNSSTGVFSTAFSTTTANTYSALNTFNAGVVTNALTIGSLTGVLHAASGVVSASNVLLGSEVSGTLPVANGGTGSTTLTGILKGNGTGGILTAVAGTDYAGPTTGSSLLYGNGAGGFSNATVSSPLTFTGGALGIQVANTSQNGYLTSTDWNTFNSKISSTSLSAVYPLAYNSSTGVFSTAFSTTTANTYSALNTFNGGVNTNTLTIGTLLGVLYGNNGVVASVATSSIGVSGAFSYSGVLGGLVGGTSGTLSLATNGVALTNLAQIAANTILGNPTGATGNVQAISTSSLGIALSDTSGTLPIARGGTNNTSYTTNGVVYYDGTKLANNGNLTYSGTNLTLTGAGAITAPQFFAADSAGAPGYSWASDAQTGMYHAGSNLIGFATGGIGRVFIDGAGFLGIGTSTASAALSVEGNALVNGTGTFNQIIDTGLTTNSLTYANASKQLSSVTVSSPLTFTTGTLGIQVANTSQSGYLTSTDWNTFNSKQAALTFTYPLVNTSNTVSLAFGTTTTNTWSNLQTFNGGITTAGTVTLGSLTGVLHAASGVVTASNVLLGSEVSGTLPVSNGGTGSTTLTGILKGNGTGGVLTAVAGTDYQAPGNYITALTGDVSASGPGSAVATLATVNGNVGTFGSSTAIPTITVNGKGLITAVTTNAVVAPAGTLTGTTLAANVVTSSLTSVGTLTALTVSGNSTFANASSTNEFSGRLTANTAAFGQTGTTTISSTGALTTPSLTIGSLSGLLYANAGAVAAASVSAPLSFSAGTLSISQANASTNGYLSSTDFNTFNGKLGSSTISGLTTNFVTKWNGSAFANSLIFDDGANLGFGTSTPSAAFSVASTSYFAANVGIGTSSPFANLSISGASNQIALANTTSGGNTYLLRNGVNSVKDFDIYSTLNRTSMLYISVSNPLGQGQVMIGTSSNNIPSNNSRLFVFGGANGGNIDAMGDSSQSGGFGDQANIEAEGSDWGTVAGGTSSISIRYFGPNVPSGTTAGYANKRLGVLDFGSASTSIIATGINQIGANNPLIFATGYTTRAVLDGSGNLGLGTTTPYAQLALGGGNLVIGAAAAGGTPGDLFLPKLGTAAGSILAVDATGKVIATTSPTGGVTSINASGGTTGLSFSGGPITSSGTLTLSGTLGIGNGGTNATGQTTNGVNYFDGTKITSGSSFTYNGTDVTATGRFITGTTFNAPTGSVGTPTYAFTGDLTTGLYRPATSAIGVQLGGAEYARFTTTGLGLGTTSPWGQLSINPNGITGPSFVIGSSTATNFLVTNAGNVGIGTTSPYAKLSVTGGAYIGVDGMSSATMGNTLNTYTTDINATLADSFQASGSLNAAGSFQMLQFNATDSGGNNVNTIQGINGLAVKSTSGSIAALIAIQASPRLTVAATATTMNAFRAQIRVPTGTAASSTIGYEVAAPTSGGTIVGAYGFHTVAMKVAGVTTGYGFASDGASDLNYFMGSTGIGTLNPGAKLTIVGTSTGTTINFQTQNSSLSPLVTGLDNGNFGIGTTSPTQALSVQGNGLFSGNISAANLTATGTITFSGIASGLVKSTSGVLSAATAGTDYAAPTTGSSLLYGNGSGGFSNATVSTPLTFTGGALGIQVANTSQNGYLTSTDWNTFNGKQTALTGTTGQLGYFSATNTFTATSSLFLASSGNVGIGSTSPYARLSIAGAGTTTGVNFQTTDVSNSPLFTILDNGNVGVGSSTPSARLSLSGGNFIQSVSSNPVISSTITLSGYSNAIGVYVVGRYAYTADAGSGFKFNVIDVSNPFLPVVVGTLTDATNLNGAFTVKVSGNYAYVTATGSNRITIIDITNPSAPVVAGSLTNAAFAGARGLYISGKYAYIIANSINVLSVVDISNPTAPVLVGTLTDNTNFSGGDSIFVSGKYAYVTAGLSNALSVVDISNPTAPVRVGTLTDATNLSNAKEVYVSGRYAYVVSLAGNSFAVIDVSNPSSPTLTGVVTNNTTLLAAKNLFVAGRYAYVTSNTGNRFTTIDISNPAAPTIVASLLDATNLNNPRGVFVSGKYAYVPAGSKFNVIDINGIDVPSANLGAANTESLAVLGNSDFGGDLYVHNALNVGGGILSGGSLTVKGTLGDNPFTVASSTGTNLLTLNQSGFLGIGTSSPYAQLSLGGGNLVIGAATAGGTPGDLFLPKLGTAAGSFLAVDANGKVIATTTPSGASFSGTVGQVEYFSGTNTAVGTSTLTISTASYVGIGTTSPASLLEISGTDTGTTATTFTPATTLSIGNRSTTNNTIATLAFRTQDATNGVASSSAQIVSINSSHTATKISGILSFQTNNAGSLTEKMRITAAGLVGIATNAPGSYLTINPATPAAGTANLNATQLVQIVGGAGGDNTANTGTVFAGNGGAIVINSGAGGSITGTPTSGFGGTGGNISFIAGAGGAGGGTTPFGGSAGTISFTAGAAASNAGAVGGDVTIGGGSASLSTAFAGSVYIAGGNASTNAATGNVILGVSISGGTPRGRVGVGTTTPWALFSIDPETTNLAGGTPEFVIGSSSATHLIVTQAGKVGIGTTSPAAQLTTTGTVQFANYGSAGATVTTDANGNLSVSSDERLKDINGSFNRGLAEIEQLSPILYHWNATSGLDQKGQYAGFSAQNVKSVIPEAVATDSRGYLTLADRPIIAASVNAIKELAGRTDTLATSSASFTAQLQTLNTAFAQNQTNLALPHALTATTLTAESLSIAQGISSGSLTAQSVNAAGTISAARYTVPAEANVFTFGSSTMSTVLPQEALTDNGSVDIYKLASYGVARVQALAERTDLLSIKIDDIESRLAAIEVLTGSSSTDPVNIVGTTLTNILSSLGVVMKDGLAMFNNLITHQLTLVGGTDGTASTGSVTMPSGSTSIVVTNALVHPSSKIFLTFTSSVDGSWYLSEKKEGSFTVMLSKPQTSDTAFDYFLIQTDPHAQVAAAGQANQPATPPPGSSEATTTPPTVSQDGGPTVSLVGDAAAQVVQGGAWTDPGATAAAADGTSLTADIVVTGTVDVQTPGLYTITYRATDAGGKIGQASRVVTVLAPVSGASDPAVTATPPADSGPTAGADAGTPAS